MKIVLAAVAALAIVFTGPASDAGAKKTTPNVKLFTAKTKTTTIPTSGQKDQMFLRSQEVRAKCGKKYTPLSIGIASGASSFAAQDIGSFGVGVYADGAAGKTKTKLQALCVRGGKYPSYIGKAVKLGADGGGLATVATLSCKKGYVALGAALSQGHGPAIGIFRSMPVGTRKWTYLARIDKYNAAAYADRISALGYPRAACVRATNVSTVDFIASVTPTAPIAGTATCKKGRALGWGVELSPFSYSSGSNGRWATPIIEEASFSGTKSMKFKFNRGTTDGYTSATPVRATVICGKLPKG